MIIQTIEGLGYKIRITEYITKNVQRRTHKKKRINKKWLKRYGMKIVPDNTKILLVNNTLMMKKEYTYEVGDVVTMKKPHPCGSKEWEILRVGADFRLKCMGCGHQIMIARKLVEKNTKDLKKKA